MEVVYTWTCGDSGTSTTDNDNDGFLSDEDPDDNDPCVPVAQASNCNPIPNCDNYTGTIFFDNCDDGSLYYFIRLANGEVIDPYFINGIEFEPKEGQIVKFDYILPDFLSPCSIADETVEVTCIEEIPQVVDDPIFAEFPWLANKVQPNTCTEGQVTVYQSGAFQFVYIEQATGDSLFFQTGQYYCETTPTYDCVAAYNLSTIVDTWTCGQSQTISSPKTNTLVRKESAAIADFTLFPNPTTGQFTVSLPALLSTEQNLRIFNTQGQLIQTIQIPVGQTTHTLDLNGQARGVYLVQMHSKEGVISKRLVLQE